MQVTKKVEYAVLSALYLAKQDRPCDIGEISKGQEIPVSFLAKIMQDLSKAKIVVSRRGVYGGFALARPAKDINLLDILRAVEGPVALSDCLKERPECGSMLIDNCLLRPVWSEVQQVIQAKLESVTLAGIIEAAGMANAVGAAEATSPGEVEAVSAELGIPSADKSARDALAALKEPPRKPVVLCDFDGTISQQDVSDTIFTLWLGDVWAQIDASYHEGRTSMAEAYKLCWLLVGATESEIVGFVDAVEIDPFFGSFVEASRGADVPIYLVSDGFDYYIERIMGRYGLSDLEHYSNKLWFEDGKICLDFGNQHEDCIDCANCKKKILDDKRNEADFIIYIGNGNSDRCAAEHADLVFAKDSLAAHCEAKGVPYVAYRHFDEIIDYLKEIGLFGQAALS